MQKEENPWKIDHFNILDFSSEKNVKIVFLVFASPSGGQLGSFDDPIWRQISHGGEVDKAALGARQTHGVKYTHYMLHAHIWACSGVYTVYYTPIFTTSQALLYLFCEAHFNIMVVHVTLGSIVKRPRARGGGGQIFLDRIFLSQQR